MQQTVEEIKMEPQLNLHNKEEYPPMHTAEHILNQTMICLFGCGRSVNAHIERKKSKCDYLMPAAPDETKLAEVESRVNAVIEQYLPVEILFVNREEAAQLVDLSKLPANASETIRVVKVGDYDTCACIGRHVANTSEMGRFKLLSHDYADGKLRVRFAVTDSSPLYR